MRSHLPFAAGIAAILLLVPSNVTGYGVALHDLFPRRALADSRAPSGRAVRADTLPGVTDADITRFRGWFYERARALQDTALRHAFLRRYPTAAAFDARAFKELCLMNGAAHVLGVDSFAAVYRELTPQDRALDPHAPYLAGQRIPLATALQLGSIYVDLDRRNQSRIWRDAAGQLRRTATGDTVPFDPMTLNMGRLTGLSSQAHGHYGLNHHPKSDSPDVLKRAPWDFAVAIGFPGEVETYAEANAQLFTDLALLALLGERPGWQALSALYAGSALHYVADVGNPVHTVQAGIYEIYVDATFQAWLRKAGRLFGLLGAAPTRNSIGLDILTNLHTLSEELFQYELAEALRRSASATSAAVPESMHGAVAALDRGDGALRRVLADTLARLRSESPVPAFGAAVTAVVVNAGYEDGADVYRTIRRLAVGPLRRGRVVIDFDTIPDDQVWRLIRPRGSADVRAALDHFNEVETRGIARVTEALRWWWGQYVVTSLAPRANRPLLVDLIVRRVVSQRLRYLEAAESRRRTWIQTHGGLPNQ
jgi:hypothetical protein